jgi:TPR repeat protein
MRRAAQTQPFLFTDVDVSVNAMKSLLVAALFFSACVSRCQSQSFNIDFTHPPQNGVYLRHFVVEAANHDPKADSPKKIFAANQPLANQGNTQAAWELALAYLQGYGVRQDLTQAEHWFQMGATQPSEKALVASMYENGEYFPKNLDNAAHWFIAAGRPGDLFELAQAFRKASPPRTAEAAAMYVDLLKKTGEPEVRRAKMELGNFVLDGKYTAGDDPSGRTLNLEWARSITEELLGQEHYKIAVDYNVGRKNLPIDPSMWLRFCKRAAAYNIDLAQHFYAQEIMQGKAPDTSGYDKIVWIRLASDKRAVDRADLKLRESAMSSTQIQAADAAYLALVQTRQSDGAYYPSDDPLRAASPAALEAMAQDDPDVQLRRAFALDHTAGTDEQAYHQAMDLYRTIRDRREMDIRFVLGRDLLNGTNGLSKTRMGHNIGYMKQQPEDQNLPNNCL